MSADALPVHTATVYVARVSSERTWQHVIRDPFGADYADAYLVAGSLSRAHREIFNEALRLEMELNVAYNFGEQHHWELNAAPILLRWQRFPWEERFATSAAFGLGLSYATEVPELEVQLEGESRRTLIFWVFELTAGPPRAA